MHARAFITCMSAGRSDGQMRKACMAEIKKRVDFGTLLLVDGACFVGAASLSSVHIDGD